MANLVELFDNIVQMQNLNGVPLANGKMYVYALGRTRLMDTWSDVDGESLNSNPIILDAAGQCHCYVSDDFDYTIVVTDAYDNEIFSIDKYLYSQGSHSHADVAVAPSETIAVSSYHVGETTVYVPYLTGQLGKVYEGIEPIVVNNTEDKISANHVPLGVQDPLYFVQDDEEGCIIGFSGQTVPEGVMTESALGFENNKITGYNGSAFSAGNEYEPGDNIDITNGVISGKDWANEINDASAAATAWTDSQGYLTGVDLSEYAKTDFVISAIDSSTSGLLPTSAFATASGSFITALPSDLATTGWVDSQGYLTAVNIPESAVWNATTQTVSANSAAWAGGTANPQIPVTGINGIKISESGDKVVFEVSGDYATTAQLADKQDSLSYGYHDTAISSIDESAIYDTSAHARITTLAGRISDLSSNKLDTSAFSDVSGTFLTAVPDTYLQNTDLNTTDGKISAISGIPLEDTSNVFVSVYGITTYNEIASAYNAGKAVVCKYKDELLNLCYTASDRFIFAGFAGWGVYAYAQHERLVQCTTTDWLNYTYRLQADWNENDNYAPSYINNKPNLANYQTTAGMTAYMATADSANFYTTANESGFITGVPAGTMNESAFGYDTNNKISGYNGSAFAGGSDVPEGVMVESGLEYNAVNEISAYNGSAIAQYGAEKQWLQHDDTLVHAANSAQYALGVNVSAVQTLMNVSEVSACMKIVNNTVTGNAGVINRIVSKVSADIPNGWNFMCWCSLHTNGWVGAVDAGSPMASATDILGVYAASNYNNTASCKVNCVYLIKKKLPGEA